MYSLLHPCGTCSVMFTSGPRIPPPPIQNISSSDFCAGYSPSQSHSIMTHEQAYAYRSRNGKALQTSDEHLRSVSTISSPASRAPNLQNTKLQDNPECIVQATPLRSTNHHPPTDPVAHQTRVMNPFPFLAHRRAVIALYSHCYYPLCCLRW
ncbi:hypothetical protein BDN71DRAFT_1286297 [Pleurotus eryngii]|uniref:Uncharacterized protein n=1 Tax=Pleurotus eryngii TaxID=5323 RepID=A0A9P5ZQD8_PLEER|nr:hypothetical protein BDN71DRAFT_1286297 [Pleurotus eryngii]